MQADEIQSFRSRPRFTRYFTNDVKTLINTFEKALNNCELGCEGSVATHHVFIKTPIQDRHFWSPQLHLQIEEYKNGSQIRGLYGPSPAVWTLFIFLYAFFGCLCLAFSIFGFTLYSLDSSPWPLWIAGLSFTLIIGTYFAAQLGQKIGLKDTIQLHSFFEESISELNEVHENELLEK